MDARQGWWVAVQIVLAAITAMVGVTIAAAGGLLFGGTLAALGLWWGFRRISAL